MDEALQSQARHLYAVEKLSIRQVAQKLGISRKKAARLISTDNLTRKVPDSIIKPYEGLIHVASIGLSVMHLSLSSPPQSLLQLEYQVL